MTPSITTRQITPIHSSWREITALFALATSICSLAATLLSGLGWWYAASYGILALSSLLSWKMAKDIAGLDRLVASTRLLERSNLELQHSEERLNQQLSSIEAQQASLSQNIQAIHQENEELHRVNSQFSQLNQNLQTANQALHASEQNLRQENGVLRTQVDRFEGAVATVHEQVAQLVDRDTTFAQTIGALQQDLNPIHVIDERLAATHQGLQEVSRLIQIQGALSQNNRLFLQQQAESLRESEARLSKDLRKEEEREEKEDDFSPPLRQLQSDYAAQTHQFALIQQEIDQWKRIQRELPGAEERLETKLKQVEDATAELRAVQAAIDSRLPH